MSDGAANTAGASGTGAQAAGNSANTNQSATQVASTDNTKNVENSSNEGTPQAPPEGATEQEKKDYRKMLRERITKHYPDADHENDETFYKNAYERYDKLSEYQKKNQAVNENMIKTFNSNPELAGFMRDVMKGAPISEAIARNLDVDSIKPMEGEPDYDKWNESLAERKKRLADQEAYLKSIDENVNSTVEEIKNFQQEAGLSDEDTQTFIKQVDAFVADAITGKVSKQVLQMLHKAFTADDQIKAAEIKGRNENIEAKKVVKKDGDGMPDIRSTTEDKGDNVPVRPNKWVQAIDEHEKRRAL